MDKYNSWRKSFRNSSLMNISRTRIQGASIFLIRSSGILGCFVYIYIYIIAKLFGALCNFGERIIMRMKLVDRKISSNIGWNWVDKFYICHIQEDDPPEIFF